MAEVIKHYLISGRVQGVGFRAFTQREAKKLNLRGWARNLLDGRVEVVALGSMQGLLRLEELIKKGPELCRVECITVAEIEKKSEDAYKDWLDFEVRKDGLSAWEQAD